jgi:NitT/TauT family transport system substrate-binding protein
VSTTTPAIVKQPGRVHGFRGGVGLALALLVFAVPAGLSKATAHAPPPGLDHVTLALPSASQAEFAGYFAAKALGYYEDFGVAVDFRPGRVGNTPEQVVAGGHAQIGLDWLTGLLTARDTGTALVNIAQMFARSGMAEITWRSSGITSVAGLKNKTVGVWCCGNQLELYAALKRYGIDAADGKGVKIVNQPMDLRAFFHHKIDAAAALTYNQLAQVLESKDPATGKLYTLNDLNVFKLQNEGTGMLKDGLFADQSWVNANRDVAMRFIAASDRGWIYCRDHVATCTNIVLRYGPALRKDHQLWQMNEINKLIWPNPLGIGVMDAAAFKQTAAIALEYKLTKNRASGKAYDGQLATAAIQYLQNQVQGVDVLGEHYLPITVKLRPGDN